MNIRRSIPAPRPAAVKATATQALILLVIGLAVWFVYGPGVNGPFIFDDFQIFVHNPLVPIDSLSARNLYQAAFSLSNGWFSRPLAMLSFSLNYLFAGQAFDQMAFKLTNVGIHVANAVMVYLLVKALFTARAVQHSKSSPDVNPPRAVILASLTAAIWALHPINLTTVLYTVQRMNSLSALFVLAGAVVFVHGRRMISEAPRSGFILMASGLIGGVTLGFLGKENAVLLPLLLLPVELVFFRAGALPTDSRRKLLAFYGVCIGIPALACGLFLVFDFDFILDSYRTRDFNITERLLTESRVLFFYLSLILLPALRRFGLYHDDFVLSTGLTEPLSTLLAVTAWCLLALLLVHGLRRRSVWAFGLAWFLAGHALESTLLGLELVHEHRNYLPGLGIWVAVVYYLATLFDRVNWSFRRLVASALCVSLVFGFVTHTRAGLWSSRALLFDFTARHHPQSYRSLSGLAASMIDQERDARAVYTTLRDAALSNPNTVYPLIHMSKVMQALLAASPGPEGNGTANPDDSDERNRWTVEPVLERGVLTRMDDDLSREILSRLRANRVHTETVFALFKAQECAINGRNDCVGLIDRLIEWHRVVLDKPGGVTVHRASLELSLAKLFAAHGDIDRALEFVNRAIQSASGYPPYRIQKALLLVKLGAIDDARRIAEEVEQGMDSRRKFERELEFLKLEIRTAADGESTAPIDESASRSLTR